MEKKQQNYTIQKIWQNLRNILAKRGKNVSFFTRKDWKVRKNGSWD